MECISKFVTEAFWNLFISDLTSEDTDRMTKPACCTCLEMDKMPDADIKTQATLYMPGHVVRMWNFCEVFVHHDCSRLSTIFPLAMCTCLICLYIRPAVCIVAALKSGYVGMFSTTRHRWKEITNLICWRNMILEFLLTWSILIHIWLIIMVLSLIHISEPTRPY